MGKKQRACYVLHFFIHLFPLCDSMVSLITFFLSCTLSCSILFNFFSNQLSLFPLSSFIERTFALLGQHYCIVDNHSSDKAAILFLTLWFVLNYLFSKGDYMTLIYFNILLIFFIQSCFFSLLFFYFFFLFPQFKLHTLVISFLF